MCMMRGSLQLNSTGVQRLLKTHDGAIPLHIDTVYMTTVAEFELKTGDYRPCLSVVTQCLISGEILAKLDQIISDINCR